MTTAPGPLPGAAKTMRVCAMGVAALQRIRLVNGPPAGEPFTTAPADIDGGSAAC